MDNRGVAGVGGEGYVVVCLLLNVVVVEKVT